MDGRTDTGRSKETGNVSNASTEREKRQDTNAAMPGRPEMADVRKRVTSFMRIGRAEFFGLLVIAVSATMAGWQTYEQYQGMRTQTVELLQQLARTGDAHIDGSLRNVDSLLRDIAVHTLRGEQPLEPGDAEFIRIRARPYPEIRQIWIADAAGVIRFSTWPGVEGYDASRRDYYLEPKNNSGEDRMFLTGPTQLVTGSTLFIVSRAMHNADDSFAGVVAASLSPAFFDVVLASILPQGRSSNSMLTLKGDILSRMPEPGSFRGTSVFHEPAFRSHAESGVAATVQSLPASPGGGEGIGVFRTLANFPLIVGVVGDRQDIVDALAPTMAMHAAFFLVVVIVTLFSVMVARRIRQQEAERGARLEASRNFFDRLLETANTLIVGLDDDGRVVLCNSTTEQVTGLKRGELLGRKWSDSVVPRDVYPQSWEIFEARSQDGRDQDQFETPIRRHPDGERIVSWSQSRIADPDGRPVSFWFGIDVTHRQSVQAELETANRQLLATVKTLEHRNRQITILRNMADRLQSCHEPREAFQMAAACVRDLFPGRAGGFYSLNGARTALTLEVAWPESIRMAPSIDHRHCGAVLRACSHRWDGNHADSSCSHFGEAYAGTGLCVPSMAHGELQGMLVLRNEMEVPQPVSCEPVTRGANGDEAALAMAVCENLGLAVSALRLRQQLQDQATRDPLTGLHNRRIMSEMFERELIVAGRKGRSLAVMMIDIDHFKLFNDRHGHEAGDVVLKAVGDFFCRQCRASDIVCRHGGEEFAILLPESDVAGAVQRAEYLREGTKRLAVSNRGFVLEAVTISIGIAVYPDHGMDARALLRAADEALYQSKILGRDRVTMANQGTQGLFKTLAWNDRLASSPEAAATRAFPEPDRSDRVRCPRAADATDGGREENRPDGALPSE